MKCPKYSVMEKSMLITSRFNKNDLKILIEIY